VVEDGNILDVGRKKDNKGVQELRGFFPKKLIVHQRQCYFQLGKQEKYQAWIT